MYGTKHTCMHANKPSAGPSLYSQSHSQVVHHVEQLMYNVILYKRQQTDEGTLLMQPILGSTTGGRGLGGAPMMQMTLV